MWLGETNNSVMIGQMPATQQALQLQAYQAGAGLGPVGDFGPQAQGQAQARVQTSPQVQSVQVSVQLQASATPMSSQPGSPNSQSRRLQLGGAQLQPQLLQAQQLYSHSHGHSQSQPQSPAQSHSQAQAQAQPHPYPPGSPLQILAPSSVGSQPASQGSSLQIQSVPLPSQQTSQLSSQVPSQAPSQLPSQVPSAVPSLVPSVVPSAVPSVVPSVVPSQAPSQGSSLQLQLQTPGAAPGAAPGAPGPLPSQSAFLQQNGASGALQSFQSNSLQAHLYNGGKLASLATSGVAPLQATAILEMNAAMAMESFTVPGSGIGDPEPEAEGDDCTLDWVVWTTEDVADWVEGLLGPGLGAAFRREGVDGPGLVRLSEESLRERLGLRDPLQRAKLLGHLRAFRAGRERLARRAARRRGRGGSVGGDAPGPAAAPQAPTTPPGGRRGNGGAAFPPSSVASFLDASTQRENGVMGRSPGASSSTGSAITTTFSRRVAGGVSAGGVSASPSGGSFALAPRLSSPASAWPLETPGPAAYDVLLAEGSSARACSPIRATIGKSPRRTSEHFTSFEESPGPSCYHVGAVELRANTSPRPTIGNSVRKTSQANELELGPGPASYQADSNMLRSSSPRPTIGTSRRNTTEFMVSRDAAEAGMRHSNSRPCHSPRKSSPRAKNRQGRL